MKILILDIETSPHLSFHWRRWQENIPSAFSIRESGTLCWAAKWYDKKKVMFGAEWMKGGQKQMLSDIWELLDEADVVVGFNSNKFDVKRLNADFLRQGWGPPSPYQKIDLLLQAKKHFAFSSNRLKDLLKQLGLTPKLEENTDMALWIDVVYHKKTIARRRMKAYNIQDVKSTEEFYEYMLGWISPHPNWGLFVDDVADPERPVCPNCGSRALKKHKVRRTKIKVYQQWKCASCGSYHRGRRALAGIDEDGGVLS